MANNRKSLIRRKEERVVAVVGRIKKRKCACGEEFKSRFTVICPDCFELAFPNAKAVARGQN